MIKVRKSQERGHVHLDWLETYHSFSFGDYFDPANIHYRWLRVINEDFVAAGSGFPTHAHSDMEIITYILDGTLEHKDSMGNGSLIRPGEIQYMSAGSGVTHSEFNPSSNDSCHLLQIWIMPRLRGTQPRYEQKHVTYKQDGLCLLASLDGREASIAIQQDCDLYASKIHLGHSTFNVRPERYVYIHVARHRITINGRLLSAGDALMTDESGDLAIIGQDEGAEFLLFDLS